MKLFSIKPYLTFLSRNVSYALINVFGLSVSLMFVLLIAVYTMQENGVDRQNSKLDRIYAVGMVGKDSTVVDGSHHYTQRIIRQYCPEVVSSAAAGRHTANLKRADGEIVKTDIMVADSTLFGIIDFSFLQGDSRNPLPSSRSAVVSESFVKRWFGDYDPMGQTITLRDSIRYTVTGVVADMTNSSLRPADMYISYANMKYFNAADMDEYVDRYLNAAGTELYLLTDGKTDLKAREAEINAHLAKNFKLFDTESLGFRMVLTPLKDLYFSKMTVYSDTTQHGDAQLVSLLFAVGVVILFFAIINYVNLTVSQSGYRAREMATRRLFGGTRFNIITQLMGESMTLCVISLAIAIVFTCMAAPFVGQLLDCRLDLLLLLRPMSLVIVLLFVILVGLFSGILSSVIISRTTPIKIVRGTFRFRTKQRLSRVFIVVQNVVTIVMLGSALTMTMQMRHVVTAPLGFNTKNIMCIDAAVSDSALNRTFVQELRKLPAVVGISACDFTPVDGGNNITDREGKHEKNAQFFHVDPQFISLLDIKVLKDNGIKAQKRVWVNRHYTEEWAETYRNGSTIKDPFYGEPYEKAGLISDFHLRNITEEIGSVILFEEKEMPSPNYILVKVQGDAAEAYNSVRSIYKQTFHMDLNSDHPYMDQQVEKQFEREVRISKIVVLFAFIAIVISLLGLVAMSTYFIQQRRKEIAVRKVFGSTGTQVRRRLLRSFMAYVAVAAVIAVPITWYAMSQWIATYSYSIVWWPWIALSCLACALISLAAVYVQSYMAGNENPIKHIKDNG